MITITIFKSSMTSYRNYFILGILSALYGVGIQPAIASVLVGYDRASHQLVSLNISDASGQALNFLPPLGDTVGLAFDNSSKRLFGLNPYHLHYLDLIAREKVVVGGINPHGLGGVAFGITPGLLYTATESNLLAIDIENGNVSQIGPTGVYTGYVGNGAFASNMAGHLFMGTNGNNVDDPAGDSLFQVDEFTGTATKLAFGITRDGGFDALTFDSNGFLYGVTQGDKLLRVDLSTWDVVEIGSVPFKEIRGLAFIPDAALVGGEVDSVEISEPQTFALLCIGLLGFLFTRKSHCTGSGCTIGSLSLFS